jgi:hypothetical protein
MARDPAAMTAAERLAEIAEILAMGFLRLRAPRITAEKSLDVPVGSEAQCGSNALNPKSTEPAA